MFSENLLGACSSIFEYRDDLRLGGPAPFHIESLSRSFCQIVYVSTCRSGGEAQASAQSLYPDTCAKSDFLDLQELHFVLIHVLWSGFFCRPSPFVISSRVSAALSLLATSITAIMMAMYHNLGSILR